MEKKTFEEPQIEIIRFTVEKILTASAAADVPETLKRIGVNVGELKYGMDFK